MWAKVIRLHVDQTQEACTESRQLKKHLLLLNIQGDSTSRRFCPNLTLFPTSHDKPCHTPWSSSPNLNILPSILSHTVQLMLTHPVPLKILPFLPVSALQTPGSRHCSRSSTTNKWSSGERVRCRHSALSHLPLPVCQYFRQYPPRNAVDV